MFKFDRKSFFDLYRKAFGALDQHEISGLEFLLGAIESDPDWRSIEEIAYVLATVKHETANTFQPIKEYRAKPGTKGRRLQDAYWDTGYYGRGFVQLTHKTNYQRAGGELHVGLVDDPDLALTPAVAYSILSVGMREGWFTKKKLSDFINDSEVDYIEARTIVNGHDKAALIAGYASRFERALRASLVTQSVTEPPKPEPPTPQINVEHAEEVKAETTIPIPGGAKDDPAKQASQGGTKSTIATILGSVTGVSAAIGGWLHNNASLAMIGIICAMVVILVWMFRQLIMDWFRMKYFADPTKINVK